MATVTAMMTASSWGLRSVTSEASFLALLSSHVSSRTRIALERMEERVTFATEHPVSSWRAARSRGGAWEVARSWGGGNCEVGE